MCFTVLLSGVGKKVDTTAVMCAKRKYWSNLNFQKNVYYVM